MQGESLAIAVSDGRSKPVRLPECGLCFLRVIQQDVESRFSLEQKDMFSGIPEARKRFSYAIGAIEVSKGSSRARRGSLGSEDALSDLQVGEGLIVAGLDAIAIGEQAIGTS